VQFEQQTPLHCLGQPHTIPYLPSQVRRTLGLTRTVPITPGLSLNRGLAAPEIADVSEQPPPISYRRTSSRDTET
jgi:hypothetical protein